MLKKQKRIVDRDLIESVRLQGCLIGVACAGPIDVDHVTTQGAGGGDTVCNLMPLCRLHHTEKGFGYSKMIKKYPNYLKWLLDNNRHDVILKAIKSGR